jgi:hypothetical protein
VWGYYSDELSALAMFAEKSLEVIQDASAFPVTSTGLFGSYLGGEISSYLVDDTFASQLLAKSVGSTVTGWVGDAVNDFFLDPESQAAKSITVLSVPNRFIGNLVSNTVVLGAGELSQVLIEAFEIDNVLASIGVSTLSQAIVNYAFTSVAVEYFPQFALNYLKISNVADISSYSLINSYASALESYAYSYASSELYKSFVRWNFLSEGQLNEGSAIGSSIGTAIGSYIAGPIGGFVGSIVGSLIGGLFGDKDFPRAAYVINLVDGKFVAKFAYELDKGNTEIASQMGASAQQILNFFVGIIGGQAITTEDVYYGHYIEQLVYQPKNDIPGGSSLRGRVGFGDVQDAVEAGVVFQFTKTQIEGWDLYIKRLLNNLNVERGTLNELNRNFQAAKEYGVYKDNPALYQEFISNLAINSVQDADKRIIDLRSHPWDRFVPNELNDALIKNVGASVNPMNITLSIESGDLLINGERIINWIKTQPKNKIQFIQFADGNIYTINIDKDNKVSLSLYEKDLTIRDLSLDILPSQVSLSLNGNDLIINGETVTNWLTTTKNQLQILRFADGSRFRIIVESGLVRVENELVANWKTVLSQAEQFRLDIAQLNSTKFSVKPLYYQ